MMKRNTIIIFLVALFTMISSYSTILIALDKAFAGSREVNVFSLLLYIGFYFLTFLAVVFVLYRCAKKGFIDQVVLKITFVVFILYGLVYQLAEFVYFTLLLMFNPAGGSFADSEKLQHHQLGLTYFLLMVFVLLVMFFRKKISIEGEK